MSSLFPNTTRMNLKIGLCGVVLACLVLLCVLRSCQAQPEEGFQIDTKIDTKNASISDAIQDLKKSRKPKPTMVCRTGQENNPDCDILVFGSNVKAKMLNIRTDDSSQKRVLPFSPIVKAKLEDSEIKFDTLDDNGQSVTIPKTPFVPLYLSSSRNVPLPKATEGTDTVPDTQDLLNAPGYYLTISDVMNMQSLMMANNLNSTLGSVVATYKTFENNQDQLESEEDTDTKQKIKKANDSFNQAQKNFKAQYV